MVFNLDFISLFRPNGNDEKLMIITRTRVVSKRVSIFEIFEVVGADLALKTVGLRRVSVWLLVPSFLLILMLSGVRLVVSFRWSDCSSEFGDVWFSCLSLGRHFV